MVLVKGKFMFISYFEYLILFYGYLKYVIRVREGFFKKIIIDY